MDMTKYPWAYDPDAAAQAIRFLSMGDEAHPEETPYLVTALRQMADPRHSSLSDQVLVEEMLVRSEQDPDFLWHLFEVDAAWDYDDAEPLEQVDLVDLPPWSEIEKRWQAVCTDVPSEVGFRDAMRWVDQQGGLGMPPMDSARRLVRGLSVEPAIVKVTNQERGPDDGRQAHHRGPVHRHPVP